MLTNALHTFLFALQITAPIFVMLFLGLWLKKLEIINEGFIKSASQLVYSLGLPVLPLALICIGGSLGATRITQIDPATLSAAIWKLILSPLIACSIAIALGLSGDPLGILFLLAASPTATISFVMVQAMNGNATLAARIVAHTTVWSLFSVTLGLWLLDILKLI